MPVEKFTRIPTLYGKKAGHRELGNSGFITFLFFYFFFFLSFFLFLVFGHNSIKLFECIEKKDLNFK